MAKDQPSPMAVAMLSSAYWNSCVLHAANDLGVFSQIGKGRLTSQMLAKKCKADPRGMEILLVACTSLGLLERRNGAYRASELARQFLQAGSAYNQSGIVSMFRGWYDAWGGLAQSVRTGKPAVLKPHDQSEEATRTYITGMLHRGVAQAELLAQRISLRGRGRMLDVAGGPGIFSIMMCRKYPGLKAVVLDLPQTLKITREIIENYQTSDRVGTQTGNYLRDRSFGSGYDALLLSSMFNQESPTVIRRILRKSRSAMRPGGIVIVQEQLLDDTKSGPALAALIGVNQLLHTPGGGSYSGKEMAGWMRAEGFTRIRKVPMPSPSPFTVLRGIRP